VHADAFLQTPGHWLLAAAISTVDCESKRPWLSNTERARADRFRQAADKERYIIAHALKRYCLSRLLVTDPQALTFSQNEKGKPYCTHPTSPWFNLSHSGNWVVLGLSSQGTIGVDVEAINRDISEGVTRYALTEQQREHVEQADNNSEQFMLYWTQKEAISKALGLGLSINFQTVHCSGKLARSHYTHKEQPLWLESRRTPDNHLVSVATVNDTSVEFYQLLEWNEDILVDTWR
jgi:4'-phosphopantetheinyl transferase